jgi:hypothetical protein
MSLMNLSSNPDPTDYLNNTFIYLVLYNAFIKNSLTLIHCTRYYAHNPI